MDPLKTGNPNPAAGTPAVNSNPNTPASAAGAPNPAVPTGTGKAGEQDPKMVPLSALHESREATKSVREELDKLKSVVGNIRNTFDGSAPAPAGYEARPAPVNQAVQANAQKLAELWESNPREAMQTEMSMMLNWYDKTESEIDLQEEEAAKKYTDFNQYRGQIKRYIRMVKPEERSKPGTVETAYYLAKGQNTDAVKQAAIDEVIAKIKAGEQIQGLTAGATAAINVPAGVATPTTDQITAANAMGMSIEDYLGNVKK